MVRSLKFVFVFLLLAGSAAAQVGSLQRANNLSDVPIPATARTNLGLPASATVDTSGGGFGYPIDGGGAAITTSTCVYTGGTPCYIQVPYSCTISKVDLLADVSGSISVEVARTTYANFDAGATHPVTGDKISASAPLTLSTATKSSDAVLTGWTKTLTVGDVIALQVSSATTVKKVLATFYCTKT